MLAASSICIPSVGLRPSVRAPFLLYVERDRGGRARVAHSWCRGDASGDGALPGSGVSTYRLRPELHGKRIRETAERVFGLLDLLLVSANYDRSAPDARACADALLFT